MSELADVFGEDFEEEYEEKRNEKRDAQNSVDDETLKEICYAAIEGEGFKGSEPRFTYEGDAVPHDVFLMQAPESKMHKFKNKFENGGMSLGMFHLEEVYGCNFNEEMMPLVEKIEEGKHYIVVGSFKEERVTQDGEEKVYKNVNVRGIVPVTAAKKYAKKREKEKSESSVEEQKEDQGIEDEDDDEEVSLDEVTDEDIMEVFKAVRSQKPEVLKSVADGDEDALGKLVALADKNIDGDVEEDHVYEVFEAEIEEIDDEEEDEDDFDLDDISSGDEDEDDTNESEESEEDEPDDEDASDESDDEDDDAEETVEDWFEA